MQRSYTGICFFASWLPILLHGFLFCESEAGAAGTDGTCAGSTKKGGDQQDQGIVPEEQDAENAEAADKARNWIISQLCSVMQAKTCSKAAAVEILQFLCTVAFVNNGSKGSKSKLAPVKLLAASEFDISEEVRNCAVARVASLATERLPCTAVPVSNSSNAANVSDGQEGADTDKGKTEPGTKHAAKSKRQKKDQKQQFQAHSLLIGEVCFTSK